MRITDLKSKLTAVESDEALKLTTDIYPLTKHLTSVSIISGGKKSFLCAEFNNFNGKSDIFTAGNTSERNSFRLKVPLKLVYFYLAQKTPFGCITNVKNVFSPLSL